jgi:hypothetical protein
MDKLSSKIRSEEVMKGTGVKFKGTATVGRTVLSSRVFSGSLSVMKNTKEPPFIMLSWLKVVPLKISLFNSI